MLGTIAAAIVNNLAGNRVWNQLSYLLARIKEQEAIWTPETNTLPALFELQPAFNKLTRDADYNRITNIVQLSVMALVPVIVIAVSSSLDRRREYFAPRPPNRPYTADLLSPTRSTLDPFDLPISSEHRSDSTLSKYSGRVKGAGP